MSGEGDKMDVDPATATTGAAGAAGAAQAAAQTLKVHPLALIAITDHQTRVVTGGSALPPTAPVVGLLFGHQDGLTVSVLDAAELEQSFAAAASASTGDATATPEFGGGTESEQQQHKAAIQQKITLHRKVFPTHEVVGWYRVGYDADPTEQDLRTHNGKMKELNESPLFLLMNAGHGTKRDRDEEEQKKAAAAGGDRGGSDNAGQAARDKLDRDEQLPVSIYESLVTGEGAAVFVNLEFELETFEPERIAVENVFKAQRQVAATSTTAAAAAKKAADDNDAKMAADDAAGGSEAKTAAAGDSKKDTDEAAESALPPPPPSELDAHLHTMKSSIESMNDRIAVLLDYLRRVQSGDIENPDYALLRQVDGLVRRLPLLMTDQSHGLDKEFESEYDSAVLLSYLAALTKTARAVRVVSDKSMLVLDGPGSRRVI